jgi:hypothetical protein
MRRPNPVGFLYHDKVGRELKLVLVLTRFKLFDSSGNGIPSARTTRSDRPNSPSQHRRDHPVPKAQGADDLLGLLSFCFSPYTWSPDRRDQRPGLFEVHLWCHSHNKFSLDVLITEEAVTC